MNIHIDMSCENSEGIEAVVGRSFYDTKSFFIYDNTQNIFDFSIGYMIHKLENMFYDTFISCSNPITLKINYTNLYRNNYNVCLRNYNSNPIRISNGKGKYKYNMIKDLTGVTVVRFDTNFKNYLKETCKEMLELFKPNVKPKQLRFGTSPFDSLAGYAGLKGETDPIIGEKTNWPMNNSIVPTFLEAGFLDILTNENSFVNRIFNIRISKKGYKILRKSLMREGRVSGKSQEANGWHGSYKNTLELMNVITKLDELFNIQKGDKI